MKRLLIVAATAAAGFALAAATTLAANGPSWRWVIGYLDHGSIGSLSGSNDLYVGAYYGGTVPVEFSGKTIVEQGADGNFEFEHYYGNPNSNLVSHTTAGTATPIQIGLADGQNVMPLLVTGPDAMTVNLQTWGLGSDPVASIGPRGHLRLHGIALVPTVTSSGTVRLEAILPDGTTQVLVPVKTKS